jgi:hypothetical protein
MKNLSAKSVAHTFRLLHRLDRKSCSKRGRPLYGRRTSTIWLKPLRFMDLQEWFPNFGKEML